MSRVERYAAEEAEKTTEKTNTTKRKKKRKLTPFGRFLDILGTVIMVAALLVCLVLSVPRFIGINTYVVVTGSMEPTIPVGSLVYAKSVEPETLQQGDVIVFYSTEASPSGGGGQNGAYPITHRVVENHTDTGEVITKGDANESIDRSPAAYINIVGKVIAHIPVLGQLAAPLTSGAGKFATVLIILAGFLLTEAGNRMKR